RGHYHRPQPGEVFPRLRPAEVPGRLRYGPQHHPEVGRDERDDAVPWPHLVHLPLREQAAREEVQALPDGRDGAPHQLCRRHPAAVARRAAAARLPREVHRLHPVRLPPDEHPPLGPRE
ncbi:unnamed protein product, partial [Prorocentrum cordatum]